MEGTSTAAQTSAARPANVSTSCGSRFRPAIRAVRSRAPSTPRSRCPISISIAACATRIGIAIASRARRFGAPLPFHRSACCTSAARNRPSNPICPASRSATSQCARATPGIFPIIPSVRTIATAPATLPFPARALLITAGTISPALP